MENKLTGFSSDKIFNEELQKKDGLTTKRSRHRIVDKNYSVSSPPKKMNRSFSDEALSHMQGKKFQVN